MSDASDIREAAGINCGACEFCQAVHVNLIDENGEIIATASVPLETCEAFIGRLREVMAVVSGRPHAAPVLRQ